MRKKIELAVLLLFLAVLVLLSKNLQKLVSSGNVTAVSYTHLDVYKRQMQYLW